MYTFDGRVRYSEVGIDGNMTLESIIDYFQDASTFHSEDVGMGVEYFKSIHQVWVLSAWQICVNRYPHLCEKIVTGTVPYEFHGFMGCRNFIMETAEGEVLAYANSIWTLLDTEKMRPVKSSMEMMERYGIGERYPMDYAPRRIAIQQNGENKAPFRVKQHHLDTNAHVNNGQYVRMAMDQIPADFVISQVRVEYRKQAVLDNEIIPYVAVNEDADCYTVALNDTDGQAYCVVEMKGRRG